MQQGMNEVVLYKGLDIILMTDNLYYIFDVYVDLGVHFSTIEEAKGFIDERDKGKKV